jgi:hypothetical protein
MTLLSALQDVQKTTLSAIAGSLRRLEYLAELRDDGGAYSHWGLTRIYGKERAASALQESHRSELSKVLRTPLRNLEVDAEQSSQEACEPEGQYLTRLGGKWNRLLPPDPGPGSSRHFSSVLQALSSLRRARKSDANRPS